MRSSFTFLLMLVALTVGAACDGVTAPETPSETFFDGAELDAASLALGAPANHDPDVTGIPGFGGLWFDARCNLNVVLTDDGDPDRTKDALTPLFRRHLAANRCPPGATIVIHRGQFTYTELTRWLYELRPVGDIRGVVSLGLSIPANRIVIGLASRAVTDEVREAVDRLGVPWDAIRLRVGGGAGRG